MRRCWRNSDPARGAERSLVAGIVVAALLAAACSGSEGDTSEATAVSAPTTASGAHDSTATANDEPPLEATAAPDVGETPYCGELAAMLDELQSTADAAEDADGLAQALVVVQGLAGLDGALGRLQPLAPDDIAANIASVREAFDLGRAAESIGSTSGLAAFLILNGIDVSADLVAIDDYTSRECGVSLFQAGTLFPPNSVCGSAEASGPASMGALIADGDHTVAELDASIRALVDGRDEPVPLVAQLHDLVSQLKAWSDSNSMLAAFGTMRFADVDIDAILRSVATTSEAECGFPLVGAPALTRVEQLLPAPSADGGVIVERPDGLIAYAACPELLDLRFRPTPSVVYVCSDGDGIAGIELSLVDGQVMSNTRLEVPPDDASGVFTTAWGMGTVLYEVTPASGLEPELEALVMYRAPYGGEADRVELTPPEPVAELDYSIASVTHSSWDSIVATSVGPGDDPTSIWDELSERTWVFEADGRLRGTVDGNFGPNVRLIAGGFRSPGTALLFGGQLTGELGFLDTARVDRLDIADAAHLGIDECLGADVVGALWGPVWRTEETASGIAVSGPIELPFLADSVQPTRAGIVAFSFTDGVVGVDDEGDTLWVIEPGIAREMVVIGGRLFLQNQSDEWIHVDPFTGTELPETGLQGDAVAYFTRSTAGESVIMSVSAADSAHVAYVERADFCSDPAGTAS